jgi:hypothetical protein
LWTCVETTYNDNKLLPTYAYSVSYIAIDAKGYYIKTNTERVAEFITNGNKSFSPTLITFEVYEYPYDAINSTKLDITNYKLNYILKDKIFNAKEEDISSIKDNTVTLNMASFVKWFPSAVPGGHFKFSYIDSKELANKIISFDYGMTEDLASFNVTANAITAAVGDKKMAFTVDGLAIYGTGFAMHSRNPYKQVAAGNFEEGVTYYIEDGKGGYKKYTGTAEPTQNYYIKQENRTLYADDDGNLTIKGKINAQAGGTIGGFIIEDNYLKSENSEMVKTRDKELVSGKQYYTNV